jgi:hypothetical protein
VYYHKVTFYMLPQQGCVAKVLKEAQGAENSPFLLNERRRICRRVSINKRS